MTLSSNCSSIGLGASHSGNKFLLTVRDVGAEDGPADEPVDGPVDGLVAEPELPEEDGPADGSDLTEEE